MSIDTSIDDSPDLLADDGDTSWMADGICAQVDPELFFPDDGRTDRSRQARDICSTCPVVEECLRYALDRPSLYGIWGGTTVKDREKERRGRTKAKPNRVMTEEDVRQAAELRDSMTHAEIGERLGWSRNQVVRALNVLAPKYGIHVTPRYRGRPGTDPALVERIVTLRARGMGYDLIAAELEMPRSTVASICQRKAAAA